MSHLYGKILAAALLIAMYPVLVQVCDELLWQVAMADRLAYAAARVGV
jgi:hypothetical protein